MVFGALKGPKIVAGGNAPGKCVACPPTLKGSHDPNRGTQDRQGIIGIRPFQGRTVLEAISPGALPPATISIPSGDHGGLSGKGLSHSV